MKNKFLAIFFGIIISLFLTNPCFALNAPTNAITTNIGTASVSLSWFWEEGGGEIEQFIILYKSELAIDWNTELPDPEKTRVGESTEYNYTLKGLEAGTDYEWSVRAEATSPSQDSLYTEGAPFTTSESQWEEEDPEEGGEGGEGTAPTIISPFENIGNIQEAADAFTEFLVITGFAVGPILIIYAAFLLLTKQGNPVAIAQAQKIILWTIISLSIMLFAKGIPSVVKDLFK